MGKHLGFWAAVGLLSSFGAISGAEAVAVRTPSIAGLEVTPVAMCGRTCRSGGRYIPGPPSVCAEEGLNYCGSSRGGFSRGGEFEGRGPGYAFDDREYLRCNPDVRRAVNRGQQESGWVHYRTSGRREGRARTC